MAIQEGIAYWASVTTPNTKYEPVYSVDLVVEDSVADDFISRGFKALPTFFRVNCAHGPSSFAVASLLHVGTRENNKITRR